MDENQGILTEELVDELVSQVATAYRIPVKYLYPIGHPKGFQISEKEMERLAKRLFRTPPRVVEVYIFGNRTVRSRAIEVWAEGALKKLLEELLPGEFFIVPMSWWPDGIDDLYGKPQLGRKPSERNPYAGFYYYRLNEDGSVPDMSWVEKPIAEVVPEFADQVMRGASTSMVDCNRCDIAVTEPDFTDKCIWSQLLLDYLSPDTEAYKVGCSRKVTFWKIRTAPSVCPDCGKPMLKDTDSIHTFRAAIRRKSNG